MTDSDKKSWDERLSPRKRFNAPVEVTIEAQTFSAALMDISESGMRVQANAPLPLTVAVKMPDGVRTRKALLIWARNSEDGIMSYGLQFVDDDAGGQ